MHWAHFVVCYLIIRSIYTPWICCYLYCTSRHWKVYRTKSNRTEMW